MGSSWGGGGGKNGRPGPLTRLLGARFRENFDFDDYFLSEPFNQQGRVNWEWRCERRLTPNCRRSTALCGIVLISTLRSMAMASFWGVQESTFDL